MDERDSRGRPVVVSSASVRVLDPTKEVRTVADLQKYQDAEGHVFSMTKEHAEKMGYTLVKGQAKAAEDAVDVEQEQAAQDAGGSEAAAARTDGETRTARRGR